MIKTIELDNVLFDISDDGRVYRHDYVTKTNRLVKGKEIIPCKNTSGYLHFVHGHREGNKHIRHMYFIHRLIAMLFVENPNPNEYNVVDHIDGNKLNNNPNNLRWTTQRDNVNNPNTKQIAIKNLKEWYSKKENREYVRNKTKEAMQREDILSKMRQPRSEEAKNKMQMKGRKWINNGIQDKFIKPSELQDYLNKGWKLGKIYHARSKCSK